MEDPPSSSTLATLLANNRKRARPTKSCLECRRKKLKCDRVQPCSQCRKLGRDSLCVFATATGTQTEESADKRVRVEVSKLATWGEAPASRSDCFHGEASLGTPFSQPANGSVPLGKVYVKGSRSKYVGTGDRMSLLDHFSDEKSFLMASFKDPTRANMLKEFMIYQKAWKPKLKPLGQYPAGQDAMLDSLPNDTVIDALVGKYTSNFENALRVLHIPVFLKHAEAIKRARRSQTSLASEVPEAALPQLLGVMAIASRLSDSNDPSSHRLSESLLLQHIKLIKYWLEGLKGKHRITLPVLRAQTLLFLANNAAQASSPQLWRDSGDLVRVAMIMGLHRDPEDLLKLSNFENEQRKKLWQTIVELDLQMSLTTGLPPALQSSDFSSETPINVDNYDLTEDMSEYPTPQPLSVWTDALPQVILSFSIKERLDTATLLARDIDVEATSGELLERAKSLERAVHAIETALPPRSKQKHTLYSNLTLDVLVRRFSLALYRRVALSEVGWQFPEARQGALRGSMAILSHLDALDPSIADPDVIQSKEYLNLFHVSCKSDILQAALLLCYEIRNFNSDQSNSSDPTPWTKHSLIRIVENTLNSHLQRLGEFGTDLKTILPLSIVLHSVRSDGSPDGKRDLMMRGIDRVLNACRRALPSIQPPEQSYPPPPDNNVQERGHQDVRTFPIDVLFHHYVGTRRVLDIAIY
ncbi:hypothetical protein BJ875DRAFT_150495 [Amylocarpus encephaloides]|uniref:Zn(2)-C6 fungal-type domain-containing protein n=1 Tax=Amylocarpus encephaloides TaxID=45428 RepID=A0A9P8C1R8_9HELO|nr:hypothetical protein BJ875DRAFT_150495 [Amylocarpus encephaloides]